ncbi:hypothetical protein [Corallococcus exiguus]|uniref:hypothetical protein n=1 Tax=Corallococcus exiguus TaxID=83462 RepID=UPI001471DD26|nr:hypothetical protein [Corallococcus exiguus]NNB84162.1 hypothetical protein [Corallococcus exiguus]
MSIQSNATHPAGHWELAHCLAEASPEHWQEKEESAADACWPLRLQQLVLTHGGNGPRLDTFLCVLHEHSERQSQALTASEVKLAPYRFLNPVRYTPSNAKKR